jgi:membrane-associated protein
MFDINHLIQTGGLLLIAIIIFSESGMMVGFFLPGDTLLLSAGIFAAQGKLSLALCLVVIAAAAILGDNVGYLIGKHLGPRVFKKKDSLIFRQEYLGRAEAFYEKHGSKTMLVAHFVPVIRAFVPVTAGAGRMPHGKYIAFDAIGDIAWTVSLVLFGYFVASRIPGVEKYVEPVLILVILGALLPTLYHLWKDPMIRAAVKKKFKKP